ncbi:MAG: agmatine deiminase family protein [Actinomycetota bacterium]
MSTPREDGLRMPAEWAPHQATLMEWPTICRQALWGELFDRAKADFAAVANAVAAFEPVVMVADPGQASEARAMCGEGVEILSIPIDDSWMRDNGPIFVTDAHGGVALVHLRFNSWGNKYLPYDRDAEVPKHVASHLGMRRYEAPMVLEGGSFFVDGEGTLLTTEQCLLHPNRNPGMTRGQIERTLADYLGVEHVIWLGDGHPLDRDTDGHVDAIAQYLRPGVILLDAPGDPADPNHAAGQDNLGRLRAAHDAAGRAIEVVVFEAGTPSVTAYMNHYVVNGAVIVPADGEPNDDAALAQLQEAYPDREIITVPGATILEGGGGPHCITQQIPAGVPLA